MLSPYNYASNNPFTNIDLWGLQGVFFQKGIMKNQGFVKAYSANQQSSIGKQFSKVLKGQKKYNVLYTNFSAAADGFHRVISDASSFKSAKKNSAYIHNSKVNMDDFNKASENGKKEVIIIGINNISDNKEDVKEGARALNHENLHGIKTLQGKTANNDKDHKEYYGNKCNACKDGRSPNDKDVLTDPKYKNSKAYKNYMEIDRTVENMYFKNQ